MADFSRKWRLNVVSKFSEFTGHKSSKALQVFERTTIEQVKAAGLAISNQDSMPNVKVPDKNMMLIIQ